MRRFWFIAVLLAFPRVGWATTYHPINVDGSLADFTPDEQTVPDPAGDSLYGANNDLTSLAVTWDAQKLYLGFHYEAEQTGVMYLIDTGKAGGISNFCPIAGYTGAFPASLQTSADVDLMVAFFAPADHATTPDLRVYALAYPGSTDITAQPGVQAKLVETVTTTGRSGNVEAAIPWDVIYGLGAGKVPQSAKLKIVGVIRGKNDGDSLGDVNPDPSSGVNPGPCGGGPSNGIDRFHQVTVDANGDGSPDSDWAPGPDAPAGTLPDLGPSQDARPGDARAVDVMPMPDAKRPSEAASGGDRTPSPEDRAVDLARGDVGTGDDISGRDRATRDVGATGAKASEGCACQLGSEGDALAVPASALLLLALLWRRRRP